MVKFALPPIESAPTGRARGLKARNIAAIREHLGYIEALQSRDRNAATASCRAHMATARSTLLDSVRQFESRG